MTAQAQGSNGPFKANREAAHRYALAENLTARERCVNPKQPLSGTAAETYAHALLSAHEAVGRYLDFADCMESRGNAEVANLFRELSRREYEHSSTLSRQMSGSDPLPSQPSLHSWVSDGPAQRGAYEIVLHFMTPWSALNIALAAKARAKNFFENAAGSTTNPQARALAVETAHEADEHVRLLEAALQKAPRPMVSDDDMEHFVRH